MKRIFLIILSIFLFSTACFAEVEGDEYDDGYVYQRNGDGDQFLRVALGAHIPLNFQKQLYVGGHAELSYYQFISQDIALGGDFNATYNISIGEKSLVTIPVSFGVMYQPSVGNFEFPITFNIGFAYETWQNMNYFPGLSLRLKSDVFYRITEVYSLGISGSFTWLPQWSKDSSKNVNALFASASIAFRYHF